MTKWNLSPNTRLVQHRKSVNAIHHISGIKDKVHDYFHRCRGSMDKIHHPYTVRTLNILEQKGTSLTSQKRPMKTPPHETRNKTETSTLLLLLNAVPEVPVRAVSQEKEIKHSQWERNSYRRRDMNTQKTC